MALSEEDRDEIVEIIRATMQRGCLCGVGAETQKEMGHFFGRLRDLGGGNLSRGIEMFSKCIGTMAAIRRFGERIGGAVAIFMFVSLVGGFFTLLGLGLKVLINRSGP